MSIPDEEQPSNNEEQGAGLGEPVDNSGDPRVGDQLTEDSSPDEITPLEPGQSAGPTPQDTNASPFQQTSLATGDPDGADHSDVVLNDETIANFADRHRVPVTVVRELNPDSVDAYGNLLANTESLRLP